MKHLHEFKSSIPIPLDVWKAMCVLVKEHYSMSFRFYNNLIWYTHIDNVEKLKRNPPNLDNFNTLNIYSIAGYIVSYNEHPEEYPEISERMLLS